MLPRAFRLRGEREIRRVSGRGATIPGRFLLLRVLAVRGDTLRGAFSISQRVSKRATKRNRLRRRLQAITAQELPNLRAGHDFVITARPAALAASFRNLHDEMRALFHRARLSSPP